MEASELDVQTALDWADNLLTGVLITNRKDGRAQSSDVAFCVSGSEIWMMSQTPRDKVANIQRDPRVTFHVTSPKTMSYVSFGGTIEVSDPPGSLSDPAIDQLIRFVELTVDDSHEAPDWDEYRTSCVENGNRILTFSPNSAVGKIKPD